MRLLHGGCGLTDRMADVASPRECNFISQFRPAMANLVYVAVDGAAVYSLLPMQQPSTVWRMQLGWCGLLIMHGGCSLAAIRAYYFVRSMAVDREASNIPVFASVAIALHLP
jgi:hypothetical protein